MQKGRKGSLIIGAVFTASMVLLCGSCKPDKLSKAINTILEVPVPVFSEEGGVYNRDIAVEIICELDGVTIYYTTDGSDPNTGCPAYEGPVEISGNGRELTLRAIAAREDMQNSPIVEADFEIEYNQAAAPEFDPPQATMFSDTDVFLSCATEGAEIYYTMDGSTIIDDPVLYNGTPISLSGHGTSVTIYAYAVKEGMQQSETGVARYTLDYSNVQTPQFSEPAGTYPNDMQVELQCVTPGAVIYYSTDGYLPTTDSDEYEDPIDIAGDLSDVIITAFAWKEGMDQSNYVQARYKIDYSLREYTLTANSAGNGGVRIGTSGGYGSSDTATVNHGIAQTIQANPDTGYIFNQWNITSGTGTIADSGSASTTVTLENGNAAATASFTLKTYELTVNAGSHGTITAPSPTTKTVDHGSPTTITAVADTGYSFDQWTTSASGVSFGNVNASNTTVTLTSEDAIVNATWSVNTYTLNYHGNGSDGGTVPSGGTYNYNETVNVANQGTMTKQGSTFDGWTTEQDGGGFSYDEGQSFNMPAHNVTLYAQWTPNYEIGDNGPAGGVVFYAKDSYSDGWRYLEAWTSDESGEYQWKTSETATPGTSTAIGAGYENTYTAMAGTEHPAAEVCRNATHASRNDWFLPSKDELNEIYKIKEDIGGFSGVGYWSSSEHWNGGAWDQLFSTGDQYGLNKLSNDRVRAIRAF
jgi:uncharacterized repeat protein (TIGR02543 family)